jgi:hypothetical protein
MTATTATSVAFPPRSQRWLPISNTILDNRHGEIATRRAAAMARVYAVLAAPLPSAACAAASRAIGTRNGEHDT